MDIEFKLSTEPVELAGPVHPLIVASNATVGEVFNLLQCHKIGCVLICEDNILKGIFTERDALRLMHRGLNPDQSIHAVMVEDPISIKPGSSIGSAILRMSSGGYRRLPIVDAAGHVTGLLQVSGVVHYLVEHIPKTIYNLPPVTQQAMQERDGA